MEDFQLLPWVAAGVGTILTTVAGVVAALYKQQLKDRDVRIAEIKEYYTSQLGVQQSVVDFERARSAAVDSLVSVRLDKYEVITEGNVKVLQSLDQNIENLVAELRMSRGGGVIPR